MKGSPLKGGLGFNGNDTGIDSSRINQSGIKIGNQIAGTDNDNKKINVGVLENKNK